MPTLTVKVLEGDIENGCPRNNWNCPICLALWRVTGQKWVVEETTCYPLTNRNLFIPLPAEAVRFISEFDATGQGKPFTFELEAPE